LANGAIIDQKEKKSDDIEVIVQPRKDFTIDQAIRHILPIVKQYKRSEHLIAITLLRDYSCNSARWRVGPIGKLKH
jgi:hypothetical protein